MEAHALHRMSIDWIRFREQVFAAAGGAQTIPQTYGAITVALQLLGDRGHSRYTTVSGAVISVPYETTGLRCVALPATLPDLPPTVGYVRVGSFSGDGSTAFARSIQDAIRTADRDGLMGWIVDLRGNTGGNMWPMLAGLGPVLGEGTAGHFIAATGERTAWGYAHGTSTYDDAPVVRVDEPYRLRSPLPRVAVLFDGHTASSGEAMILAFRGREGSRSFGARSCGVATGVSGFPLSSGARLALATVWIADRHGTTFPLEIDPDEPASGDLAVARAVEWLTTGR